MGQERLRRPGEGRRGDLPSGSDHEEHTNLPLIDQLSGVPGPTLVRHLRGCDLLGGWHA